MSGYGNDATLVNVPQNGTDSGWINNQLVLNDTNNGRLDLSPNLSQFTDFSIEIKTSVAAGTNAIPTFFAKRTQRTNGETIDESMLFCLYVGDGSVSYKDFWFETSRGYNIEITEIENFDNSETHIYKIYCNQSEGFIMFFIDGVSVFEDRFVVFDSPNSTGQLCFGGVPDATNETSDMTIDNIKFYKGFKI